MAAWATMPKPTRTGHSKLAVLGSTGSKKAIGRAGMLVAEQQFRRIIGYRDLAKLVIAIERHAARTALRTPTTVTHTQVPEAVTV